MVWSQSSGTLRGHEGQPLVIEDVGGKPMMFMESGWPNIVQALDLSDPDHPVNVWTYSKTSGRDESAVPRACCDTVNRGLSYADGKLVFGTLDGYVIALDAATGKEAWVVKSAYPDHGETITPAPIIANDKVIIGFGGDEFAARGAVTAYNLADGKVVWKCYSTGSDKDVCLTTEPTRSIRNTARPARISASIPIPAMSGSAAAARRGAGMPMIPTAHGVLRHRQPGPVVAAVSLCRADHPGELQQRQVRQQVVDDAFSRATSTPAKRRGPTR